MSWYTDDKKKGYMNKINWQRIKSTHAYKMMLKDLT